MRTPLFLTALVLLVLSVLSVKCQAVVIDTVLVGDVGNQPDTRYGGSYGSVGYAYNIGKYEVTAGQYTDFLNAVARTDSYALYNAYMADPVNNKGCNIQRSGTSGSYTYSVASDWANRPVNFVNYWDACRFANWLHNGQPTGLQNELTTEDGVYAINGYGYYGYDGRTIQRKAGWRWAITSEDEWYKAAYYKRHGQNAGYWDYPTQSNEAPSNVLGNPTDPGNNATFYGNGSYTIGSPYYRTEAGTHENSESAYGTFDQGGNVMEWNEAIVDPDADHAPRGLRGGVYDLFGIELKASRRLDMLPTNYGPQFGFRITQAVPEPASLVILAGGLMSLLGIRRFRV